MKSRCCPYASSVGRKLVGGVLGPCSDLLTHVARGYYRGAAVTRLGHDMFVCAAHASMPTVRLEELTRPRKNAVAARQEQE